MTYFVQVWQRRTQLLTLPIRKPSIDRGLSPICSNTFCMAKSPVVHATCIRIGWRTFFLDLEVPYRLTFFRFSGVIHSPSSSSSSSSSLSPASLLASSLLSLTSSFTACSVVFRVSFVGSVTVDAGGDLLCSSFTE